jgi:hypothetical protein
MVLHVLLSQSTCLHCLHIVATLIETSCITPHISTILLLKISVPIHSFSYSNNMTALTYRTIDLCMYFWLKK